MPRIFSELYGEEELPTDLNPFLATDLALSLFQCVFILLSFLVLDVPLMIAFFAPSVAIWCLAQLLLPWSSPKRFFSTNAMVPSPILPT